jgi:tol-pal system protein YbgF
MTPVMTVRRLLTATTALLLVAGPALAQDDGSSRRIDQLERQIRELRAIVFQGRDTGQPVEVKPAGPDPAVTALDQRVSGLDDALRQIKGQLEELEHNVDQARTTSSSLQDQNGALHAQLDDLKARVARLEAQLAPDGGGAIPPGPGAPAAGDIPPPPTPAASATATSAATAAAQAADTGRLGGPSSAPSAPPPAAPPAEEAGPAAEYRAARALVTSGDYAGASNGFQNYITAHPAAKNLPEAYYWLGESDYAREDYQDATPAYARALKGWPKLAWAPDATVKLARALAETSRTTEACAALAEFDHRYRAAASNTVRARAQAVRARAQCGA